MEIPTNRPVARVDHHDEIYRTAKEKYNAIIDTIIDCQKRGQPILVGTTSIEKSELVADMLRAKSNIKFEVLNARHHEREAAIVAQAGVPGAVTIATNMAGRGTDIQLGGNLEMRLKEVLKGDETEERIAEIKAELKQKIAEDKEKAMAAGGLYVLGTERHESRRIDNQLRGRSGRQGDPGTSKFFLSMEDDLMRIFGSERMSAMLQKMGLPEGEPLIHPWISKALEKAQQKVEERNFDIRKNLLKYDNVMNDQRKVIYEQRKELMQADDVSETIEEMRQDYFRDLANQYVPFGASPGEWRPKELAAEIARIAGIQLPVEEWAADKDIEATELQNKVIGAVENHLSEKNRHVPADLMRMVEKSILLQVLDQLWKDHIAVLDHMRHTIVLRAYGQKDPLNEYKKEAFNLFSAMLDQLRERTVTLLCRVQIQNDAMPVQPETPRHRMQEVHEAPEALVGGAGASSEPQEKPEPFKYGAVEFDPHNPATWGKISRNDPCPCGSGKKFKHCHGRL